MTQAAATKIEEHTMTARLASIVLAVLGYSRGAVETVRVELRRRLRMVDGKPVRARMFWGAAARQLSIGPEAKKIAFESRRRRMSPAGRDAPAVCRHGGRCLDDIRVVDLDDSADVIPVCDFEAGGANARRGPAVRPTRWEDSPGGRAASCISTQRSDDRWPDYHLYHLPTCPCTGPLSGERWVRPAARKLTVAFTGQPLFRRAARLSQIKSRWPPRWASTVKLSRLPPLAAAGKSRLDKRRPQCRRSSTPTRMRCCCPHRGAGVVARPIEDVVWDRGRSTPAVASNLPPRAAERLPPRASEENFGDHIASYHLRPVYRRVVLPGNVGAGAFGVFQPPGRRGGSRYQSDDALRAAWRDRQVALETAEVPSPAARRASPAGVLRDPVAERPLIDFAEFQQEMMADCVCHFARTARQATGGKKLVVFFYGYVFEFGAIHNGPATAGHYALRRVLDCPEIDVLCSPISFFDRGLGQCARALTAGESIAVAGKMWLYEDDTRTYLGTGRAPGWQDGVDTLEETNRELLRNTAQCALRNFGTWWMDLGATGWFEDRRMWEQMERLRALDEPLLESPLPFRPEVAAVVDEPSMIRVAYGGDLVTRPGVYEARRPLGRMGAPYGQYLLDDVSAGRVGAKMFVFLNAWCLSPGDRRQVRDATRGKLCVWCYAPGYQEPGGGERRRDAGTDRIQARPSLAGKRMGRADRVGQATRHDGGFESSARHAAAGRRCNARGDPATYADGCGGRLAANRSWLVVVRRATRLDIGTACLAARKAASICSPRPTAMSANGSHIVLHASQAGPLQVNTGRPGPVIDLLSGELGQGPTITLPAFGETRVLVAGDRPALDRR